MARVHTLVSNFAKGQLSTRLAARADTSAYRDGARSLLNAEPMIQGGWQKRAGTMRLAATPGPGRLEGRVFGRDEAYVLCFTAGRLDVYRVVADGVTPVGGFTNMPWTAETLWFMDFDWFGNLAVIVDASFRPRVLRRVGPNAFQIAELVFATDADGVVQAPRHKFGDSAVLMAASDTYGTVTLSTSAPVFEAGHVGEMFALRGAHVVIASVENATTATGTVIGKMRSPFDPNPFYVVAGSTRVVVTLVEHGLRTGDFLLIEDTLPLGGNTGGTGEIDLNGSRVVTDVIDEDRFVIAAPAAPAVTEDGGGAGGWLYTSAPTRAWAEPVFSAVRGWPQAVAFHNGRLWLGGAPSLGDAAFGSVARNFFSFDAGGGEPADAIYAIGETQTNAIRHLVSAGSLLSFGDTGEASFQAGDQAPLNQANIEGRPATQIGASYMRPLRYDGAVLFGDALGQHVYEFAYVEQFAAYSASPVSALCPELLAGPRHAQVFQGSPGLAAAVALFANSDGTAALYHGRRSEQIAAWAPWRTNGKFVSFAAAGTRLFACCERQADGAPGYWIEEFAWGAAVWTDSSRRMAAAEPTAGWAAPEYGVGTVLDVVAAGTGAYLGRVTTGPLGSFLLPSPQSEIVVGYPVFCVVETMPPPVSLPDGPRLGSVLAAPRCVVHFHETSYATVNASVFTAQLSGAFNDTVLPWSGPHEVWSLGWSREPTVRIASDLPLPMGVLGVLVEVVLGPGP